MRADGYWLWQQNNGCAHAGDRMHRRAWQPARVKVEVVCIALWPVPRVRSWDEPRWLPHWVHHLGRRNKIVLLIGEMDGSAPGRILPREHATRSCCRCNRLKLGKSLGGKCGLEVQDIRRVRLRLSHDGSVWSAPLANSAGRG